MALRNRSLVVALAGAGMLAMPISVESCGPFFTVAAFTFMSRPELPESYAQGKMGIVLPGYPRLYRFVAWRYLTGAGLNAQEQKAIRPRPLDAPASEWISEWSVSLKAAPRAWLAARRVLKELPPPVKFDPDRELNFASYANCGDDAFRAATETLAARAKTFGPSSPELRDWVQGQDAVFSNCKEKQITPSAAPPGAGALLQADRAYQIAAARFYAGDLDAAEAAFRGIAADIKSPWRATAAYLMARVYIRKATLSDPVQPQWFREAEKQLRAILADASLAAVHASAKSLLDFVRSRVDPVARLLELGHLLAKPGSPATLSRDLVDYRFLFDKLEGDAKIQALASQDELTDWLLNSGDLAHTLARWHATGSLPWLLASLARIQSSDPALPDLLKDADRVRPDSPGYASVAFYSNRLLIESGRAAEARRRLDSILSGAYPQSAMNLFLAQRMRVAATWDEFLRFAPRTAVGSSYDGSGESKLDRDDLKRFAGKPLFDADSAGLFNSEIPLSRMRDAAAGPALADSLRASLARAGWVRAVMSGDDAVASDFARVLLTLDPALKPALDAWLSAAPDSKRFAAIFLMLNNPGASPFLGSGFGRLTRYTAIDDFRDNWWCAISPTNAPWSSLQGGPLSEVYRSGHPNAAFLTAPDRQRAAAELGKLQALPAAPTWLASSTIAFARQHPDDPQVPQALHLAVRATRYGCTDEKSGAASKQAFDLLHRQYPNSEWARKTKFWYESKGAPKS